MSFADAVRSVLSQYATFTGRARRSEFWFFVLFTFLVSLVAGIIDQVLNTDNAYGGLVSTLASLALLVPSLAVGARRLHDTGRSGWLQLLALIPLIGIIVLIVWWCQDSAAGDNAHGPSPKAAGNWSPPASADH